MLPLHLMNYLSYFNLLYNSQTPLPLPPLLPHPSPPPLPPHLMQMPPVTLSYDFYTTLEPLPCWLPPPCSPLT